MKYKFFFLLLWIIGASTALLAEANYVRGVALKGDKLKITFKFPLKKVKHFMIAKRGFTKHIYDVQGGVLPPRQKLPFKHKNVKSFRIGQYTKQTLRIVIETTKGEGAKYSIRSKVLTIPLPTGKRLYSKRKRVDRGGLAHKDKKIYYKKRKKSKNRQKSVVIDAGHGGRDNGASSSGVYEKKLTLTMAYKVKKRLEKMGYKVYMTRKKDRYISLLKRTQYANKRDANIFVSIHANAAPHNKENKFHGLETFYLSSSNTHVRNKKIIHKKKTVYTYRNDLYHKLLGSKKRAYSKYLAKKIEKQISRNIRRSYGPVVSKIKCSDFWVLTGTKMPSILVETGYVTHKKDRKRLTNNHYQNLVAKGIAEGINSYFYGRR